MSKKKNKKKNYKKNVNHQTKKCVKTKKETMPKDKLNLKSRLLLKYKLLKERVKKTYSSIAGNIRNFSKSLLKNVKILLEKCKNKANKIFSVVNNKGDIIWEIISETRKISVPVIICVYTILVVVITTFINHAHVIGVVNAPEQMSAMEDSVVDLTDKTFMEKGIAKNVNDGVDLTYRDFKFTKTVTGENSKGFGHSYENTTTGNTYLDIKLEVNNKSDQSIGADKYLTSFIMASNQQYVPFVAVETEGGKSIDFASNVKVEAGQKAIFHLIFDVPEALEKSEGAIEGEINCMGKTYKIKIR